MRVVRAASDLSDALSKARDDGKVVGFVPTMGALHDGHLSLVRLAHEQCDVVLASIFVNPLQFSPGEDFEHYPRDIEGDLELLEGEDTHIVFIPSVETMYPPAAVTTVHGGRLAETFEGADRPGHFDGVCTVVAKLFHLAPADKAFFGQKDAQQVAILKAMVRDLSFPIELVVGPIVREATGLALSSRNAYLSPDERKQATALYRSLCAGEATYLRTKSIEETEKAMADVLTAADGVSPSYARAVDPVSFEPGSDAGPVLLIVAAHVGPTRLIDNLLVGGG